MDWQHNDKHRHSEKFQRKTGQAQSKKRKFSEKSSETSRGLAFAQIALFWMFLKEFGYQGNSVYCGLISLIFYFFFDVGQYISGLFSYKYLCKKTRKHIKEGKYSEEYINNKGVNTFPNLFFCLKVALLLVSSTCLGILFYKLLIGQIALPSH